MTDSEGADEMGEMKSEPAPLTAKRAAPGDLVRANCRIRV